MTAKDVIDETTATPWKWLKTISKALYDLDKTPLLGYSPEFPFEKFATDFASSLGLADCSVLPGELSWRDAEQLCSGIAAPHFWTEIALTGIDGTCFLVASRSDIQAMMNTVLGIKSEDLENQKDELINSFHRFLTAHSLELINNVDFDKRIAVRAQSFEKKNVEAMLCQDLQMKTGHERFLFRLCMPASFLESWRTFFKAPQKTLPPTKERLEQAFVTVHLEAARLNMTLNELLQIRPGDFVVCDQALYIPNSEQNHVVARVGNKPLFLAEHKDGSLKVLEIPLHREVYDSMVDKVNPSLAPSAFNPNDRQPMTPSIEDEKNPFEDDENPFEDEEEEEEDFAIEPNLVAEAPAKQQKPTATPAKKPTGQAAPLKALTPDDVPLTMNVEIGQIDITAQKLLELQPGNMIDLQIDPDSGVDLVINGRIIGKAELLQIGQTVGIRILQIGT